MTSNIEKRLYPRVACRLALLSELVEPKFEGIITDLSLNGMGIRTGDPIRIGDSYQIGFLLPFASKPIKVESKALNHLPGSPANKHIGFRIENIAQRDTRLVKQFVLDQMSIDQRKAIQKAFKHLDSNTIKPFTDRKKVEALLARAQTNQAAFTIVQEDKSQSVSCRLQRVGSGLLEFTCETDYIGGNFDINVPVIVAFSTEFNSYHFETFLTAAEECKIEVETPKAIFFSEKRFRERESIPAPRRVYLDIPLPYPKGQVIRREVVDLSSNGLSFKTPARENYFLPGTPLPEIRIISEGENIFSESAEVKHIAPFLEDTDPDSLRIGLEFSVNRQNVILTKPDLKLEQRTGSDRREIDRRQDGRRGTDRRENVFQNISQITRKIASQGFQQYFHRWRTTSENDSETPIDIVNYFNRRNEEIVAILSTTAPGRQKIKAPVIIVPPAFGRRKESTGGLALTLVENFTRHRRDVVVLRYDGIRCIGESHKDRSCRFEGKEMINMTLSQGMEDILTTLDYVSDNPRFEATEIVLVSFSLASCMARKAILLDGRRRVRFWVNLWGATDAQEAIRNSTGGVDFIGNYQRGVSCGITNVLGHLVDNDRFCTDAIRSGMAYLEDAKRDMSQIDIPVTWLYGKYDDWINPDRIRDIMSIRAKGTREIVELPTGHMPTTNEEAMETYQLVTRYIWRYLFGESIDVRKPSPSSCIRLRNAEWSRTPKYALKDQADYWEKYLLGQGQLEVGFDVMAETPEYQDFMNKQIDLLGVSPGDIIGDLGGGTGLFCQALLNEERTKRLFQDPNGNSSRVITVDLVNSALEKSKLRLSRLASPSSIVEKSFEFRRANLEVSRLKPIWRFLRGEYFSVAKFNGKIEGLPEYSVDLWLKHYTEFLHQILRGKILDSRDCRRLRKEFADGEVEILLEMNRAARFVLKRIRAEDFKDPGLFAHLQDGQQPDYSNMDSSLLSFTRLNFRRSTLELSLPFRDCQFNKILCSALISYLFNPEESLQEFHRMLKPGGKIVVSTFRPDVDMSRVYNRLIQRIENDSSYAPPNGMTKEDFLNAVRSFANSAAFLLQLEEQGHFRFFSRAELKSLLESAGFENISVHDSFGSPPQVYVALGTK